MKSEHQIKIYEPLSESSRSQHNLSSRFPTNIILRGGVVHKDLLKMCQKKAPTLQLIIKRRLGSSVPRARITYS